MAHVATQELERDLVRGRVMSVRQERCIAASHQRQRSLPPTGSGPCAAMPCPPLPAASHAACSLLPALCRCSSGQGVVDRLRTKPPPAAPDAGARSLQEALPEPRRRPLGAPSPHASLQRGFACDGRRSALLLHLTPSPRCPSPLLSPLSRTDAVVLLDVQADPWRVLYSNEAYAAAAGIPSDDCTWWGAPESDG